jgi:hypothetical protein
MNILEQEDLIKGLPDQVLVEEAQAPTGNVPQYLVVSEIQRREKMREKFNEQVPQNTVTDQIISGGIAAMNPNPDPLMGMAMGAPPPMMGQDPMMGQMQDPMMGQMQDPMMGQMPQDIAMGQQMPQDPMMQMQDPMMQDPMMQQGIMAAGGGMMPYRMQAGRVAPSLHGPAKEQALRGLMAQGYSRADAEIMLANMRADSLAAEMGAFRDQIPELGQLESIADTAGGIGSARYAPQGEAAGYPISGREQSSSYPVLQGALGPSVGKIVGDATPDAVFSGLEFLGETGRDVSSAVGRDMEDLSRVLGVENLKIPEPGELLPPREVGRRAEERLASLIDSFATPGQVITDKAPEKLSTAKDWLDFIGGTALDTFGFEGANDKQQSPLDSDASVEAARLYAEDLFGPRNNLVVEGEKKKIDKGSVSEVLSEGVDPDLASRSLREDVSRAGEVDPALFEMIMAGEAGGAGKVNPRAKSRMAEGLAIAQLGAGIAKGSVSEGLSGAADAFMDVRESERKERQTDALEKYYQATGQASLQRALLGAAGGLSMDKALEAVMENDKDFDGTQKSSMPEYIRQAQELMRRSRIPGADVNPERIDPAIDADLRARYQQREISR